MRTNDTFSFPSRSTHPCSEFYQWPLSNGSLTFPSTKSPYSFYSYTYLLLYCYCSTYYLLVASRKPKPKQASPHWSYKKNLINYITSRRSLFLHQLLQFSVYLLVSWELLLILNSIAFVWIFIFSSLNLLLIKANDFPDIMPYTASSITVECKAMKTPKHRLLTQSNILINELFQIHVVLGEPLFESLDLVI